MMIKLPSMIWLLLLFIFTTDASSGPDSGPVIRIKNGNIRGLVKHSMNGRPYWSFTGIPYATPPVGDLRFVNPIPAEPWSGVLDATKYSSRCIQRDYLFYIKPPIEGSEDCLYMNVYVPQVNHGKNKAELPVIFSIHWGGMFGGGGDRGYFDPLYQMDYDVIIVTFNYRLGIFGFLSTFDDESPGNYCFKDQVLALKWVQENIGYFGGAKENVTIMGQSGGSASVQYHLISPSSDGLFTKAISQSGSALNIWARSTDERQLSVQQTQAELVNCSYAIGNSAELIACFRNVSAEEILETQDYFKIFGNLPHQVWSTVTEKRTDRNPDPFLTKPVIDYFKNGDFKKVPYLVGATQYEGIVIAAPPLTLDEYRTQLNESFDTLMPELLALSQLTNDTDALWHRISQLYLNGNSVVNLNDRNWLIGFFNILSDRFIVQSTYESLELQLSYGHHPIYYYSFEYSGEYTYAKFFSTVPDQYNETWGVCHCDDMLYQFYASELFRPISAPNDLEVSNVWLSLWHNFAIYGDPNPRQNKVLKNVDWPPLPLAPYGQLNNDDIRIMNVTGNYLTGPNFKVTRGLYKERMQFWDSFGPV